MTGYTGTTPASPEATGGITQYYYQVETVVTPVGYNGYHWDAGADRAVLNSAPGSVTLYSNVIGPNSGTAAGTGTLAHVRW